MSRRSGPGTVRYREVSLIGMTTGGEKRIRRVIHDGELKEWVGFGWISLRTATADDLRRYPRVKR